MEEALPFLSSDQFLLALRDFDKALEHDANHAEAYTGRVIVKSALGRSEEALTDYEEALVLYFQYPPDDHLSYFLKGLANSSLGRHAEALADYDAALNLNPPSNAGSFVTYVNRGNANLGLGRYAEALTDYDQALSHDPGNPDVFLAYFQRGEAQYASGQHEASSIRL